MGYFGQDVKGFFWKEESPLLIFILDLCRNYLSDSFLGNSNDTRHSGVTSSFTLSITVIYVVGPITCYATITGYDSPLLLPSALNDSLYD